jgi:hypothetical protein
MVARRQELPRLQSIPTVTRRIRYQAATFTDFLALECVHEIPSELELCPSFFVERLIYV